MLLPQENHLNTTNVARKETLSSTDYSNYNVYNNQQQIVFDDATFFLGIPDDLNDLNLTYIDVKYHILIKLSANVILIL